MPPPPDEEPARVDPNLVDAARVARAWGVRPSVFLGASTLVMQTDAVGRQIVVEQPGWSEADRELAFALDAHEVDLHACGRPLSETSRREHEGAYVPDGFAVRCHYCTALDAAAAPYRDSAAAHALSMPLRLDEDRVAANLERIAREEAATRDGDPGAAGAAGTGGAAPAPG